MLACWLVLFALAGPADAGSILQGAGSSSVQDLLTGWGNAYRSGGSGRVRYDAVGSGEGIRRVAAGEATFALSNVALGVTDLQTNGLVQFPLVLDGIVPVV